MQKSENLLKSYNMETNNSKAPNWDKSRQEIDQLKANLRKAKAKIDAIREYAENLPADLDSVRREILQRIQS